MSMYLDLFMRDTFTDNGIVPVPDTGLALSPDIIPFGSGQLNTAVTPYGPPLVNAPVNNNNVNNVYVRAKNNAPSPTSGRVYLYWTPATLLTTVSAWSGNAIPNFNGLDYAALSDVPSGTVAFGDQPFAWNPQNGPRHCCLIARVETEAHPNPLPAEFVTWASFVDWVRFNANVAWHNCVIVNTLPAQGYQNSLLFANPSSSPSAFTFLVTWSGVPVGSMLQLKMLQPPGNGFQGFDVSTDPTAETSGELVASGYFPANYQTLIYTTCVFPGGPTTPPAGAEITIQSLGLQDNILESENARFAAFSHPPEYFGVRAADVGLSSAGMLVPIMEYKVLFSPTANL